MTNFAEILSRRPAETERPKTIPAGTYTGTVLRYETGNSQQKQTPYIRVHFGALQPFDDVDEELAAEIDWVKKTIRDDFYLTEDALYRLAEFLEMLGLEESGRTYSEMLPEMANNSIVFTVSHTPNQKDPEAPPYANITGYAPAE